MYLWGCVLSAGKLPGLSFAHCDVSLANEMWASINTEIAGCEENKRKYETKKHTYFLM